MRLCIGLESVEEALLCATVARHLDLVEVLKPDEGPAGAAYPWVVRGIREALPTDMTVSVSLGDAPFRPGSVAQAALGAAATGADHVRVGLFGVATPDEAITLMRGAVRAVKEHNRAAMVVATGYADARRIGGVNPLSIPYVAHESGADGAMLDTAVKDGSSLFDHLAPDLCGEFVSQAHDYNLLAALAGSVQIRHVPELMKIEADIVSVRGAVCQGGDRGGTIQPDLVQGLREAIDEA